MLFHSYPIVFIIFIFLYNEASDAVDICEQGTYTNIIGNVTFTDSSVNPDSLCFSRILTTGNKVIEVTFVSFEIECSTTTELRVYDGAILYTGKSLCGTSLPRNFVSHHPEVSFVLISRDSLSADFFIRWEIKDKCKGFSCWDGTCVAADQQCDGTKDCPDNSDEMECAHHSESNNTCGKQEIPPHFYWDLRIVGGHQVNPGSWPWQIQLQINQAGGNYNCGGSIISPGWIVTAAHCVIDANLPRENSVQVIVDKWSSQQNSGFQNLTVGEVIIHPSYKRPNEQANDIALLRLNKNLTFTETVRPICLPSDSPKFDVPTGTVCVATGWGALDTNGQSPNKLYQVRLPVVSQSVCENAYKSINYTQICAGHYELGGVDSCQGDSGGPFVCLIDETTWFLIGVTSFGIGCGQPGYPGVYARVSKYSDWIAKETGITPPSDGSGVVTINLNLTLLALIYSIVHLCSICNY